MPQEDGFRLSRESTARVRTVVDYLEQNRDFFAAHHGRIVFSGGWSGARRGLARPPAQFREGTLMLDEAAAASVAGKSVSVYAETFAEIDSDSTLENLLRIREAGYFRGVTFSAENPLGFVAHQEHASRIDYLARKTLGLPRPAIAHIIAPGPDETNGAVPESLLLLVTRLTFAGARGTRALRRRQRALVALNRIGGRDGSAR
jgi:hypothetical protein